MLSRRTVLTATLAAGVLSACRPDDSAPPVPANPDEEIVAEALAAQTAFLALLDSVTQGRPRRRRALAATRRVHLAHRRLLAEALPGPGPDPSPGTGFVGGDRLAYLALAQAEDELAAQLRAGALRAQSGPFARVLAGMAAAAAQQAITIRGLG